jgi:hypothetical protein
LTFYKIKRLFALLLGGAVLGAVSTTPASASTLLGFALTTGGSNTATFSSGALQGISGWAPGSVTYNGMTYTVTGGTTTFTKGVMDTLTMSGTITGLAGLSSVSNLLAVSWWTPSTADEKSGGTSPNPIYLHSGAVYVFHPLLINDLSFENPTGSASPGFSTNGCVSTCSPADIVTTSSSATYPASIETLSVAASTPEPASFLLIGAGLIAASIVRKKKIHRSGSAR